MPHKRAPKPNNPKNHGGGLKRRLAHIKWIRKEVTKEGRSPSPLLPKVTSTITVREATPAVEVITIDDSPLPTPTDQEAVTPQPPYCPPTGSREVLSRPTPPPYHSSPQASTSQIPSSISPYPGIVEILDTGSATKVPDHTELTPAFLRWFDDQYQNGYDLTFILDDPSFSTLEYSFPPY